MNLENLIKKQPVLTFLLILINCAVFLAESLGGGSEDMEVAVRFGALYTPYVLERGEWYRLFTAMFLHFGISHLGRNMLAIFAVGPYVELFYGKARYLLIYLFGGISGNLLALLADALHGTRSVTAGASGAICGLFSVFLLFAMLPAFRRNFPIGRVLIAIALLLAPGFLDHSISQAGHVGGLLGGFIMAALLLLIDPKLREGSAGALASADLSGAMEEE